MTDIISKRLENGAMCYILPKKGYNEKEVMIAFNYGSADTEFFDENGRVKQTCGIAHFLEHKMFEEKEGNIFDSFSRLGLSANAYTDFNTTAYYFSGCENMEKGFDLLMEMVGSLYLTAENIDKEKGIITQEINMYEDDPYWQIYFNTLKAMYSRNPIRYSIAGRAEDIESITEEELKKSYESFYTYENCAVIVCGDVDCDTVSEQAEKLKLGAKSVKRSLCEDDIYKREYSVKMPVEQSLYHIGYRADPSISIKNRICISNIIMNLLCSPGSALYERLYEKSFIDSSFGYEVLQGKDYGCALIKGEGNNYRGIAEEIDKEIKNMLSSGIDGKDVKRAAERLKTHMLFSCENISSLVSHTADCFSKNTEVLDIYDNYDKIDVDDIMLYLKKQFGEDNRVLSTVEKA